MGIPTAGRRGTQAERFEAKVARVPECGCWVWTGCVSKDGYGKFGVGLEVRPAHRASYEMHVGPIPDGLHIDHLCRVRCCVNPRHLEPVTCAENIRRGVALEMQRVWSASITHCPQGHEYTAENTRTSKMANGQQARYCRESKRIKGINRYHQHREEINRRRSASHRRTV